MDRRKSKGFRFRLRILEGSKDDGL